jgi:NAD(P)-dependent dehydrogenase (short-subunit alcohol dehydrogenase family)
VTSVVVVTGGATHLGRATAELFARQGLSVVIASRDRERCETVAQEIVREHGPCSGTACDVTDPQSVQALFETVMAEHGQIDILVCNAGASLTKLAFPEAGISDVDDTIRVNLLGSYLCANAAAPYMIPRRSGAIVFVSSVHGVVAPDPSLYESAPGFISSGPAYHAAKGGIIQLARSLAASLGRHGIRVNCVSPGMVPTSLVPTELAERFAARTPLGRVGTPDDVAQSIAFLASDKAAWITGQNLVVDGGWTIW